MKKICIALVMLSIMGVSTLFASEIGGELNPSITVGLEIGLPCSPSSVSHGTVNPATCAITCNNGYSLQGQQCVQQSGGGGGGGGGATPDYCPNGDFSGDFYDRECGTSGIGGNGNTSGNSTIPSGSRSGLPYGGNGACSDPEYNLAYSFAFQYGITTMPTCLAADMDGWLIRSHAAKMISNYAINVVGKTPDMTKSCIFDDMANETLELQAFAITACRLGLMGLEADGVTPAQSFNPNEYLHKAHFSTMLSRLLFGSTYDGNYECRYCDHVDKMVEDGVITVVTDLFDPLKRGFAMIMLMRSSEE